MPGELLAQHVITLLCERWTREEAIEKRVTAHEAAGGRVVDGGQINHDTWMITDYRTGNILVQGDGGLDGFVELLASPRAQTWALIDPLTEDLYDDEVHVSPGIPRSLCEALDDWVGTLTTPDEDIAHVVGWPVERVRAAREE